MKRKKPFQMSPSPALPLSSKCIVYIIHCFKFQNSFLCIPNLFSCIPNCLSFFYSMATTDADHAHSSPTKHRCTHRRNAPDRCHQTGLHLLATHPLATHLPTLLPPHPMLLQNLLQSTLSMKRVTQSQVSLHMKTQTTRHRDRSILDLVVV